MCVCVHCVCCVYVCVACVCVCVCMYVCVACVCACVCARACVRHAKGQSPVVQNVKLTCQILHNSIADHVYHVVAMGDEEEIHVGRSSQTVTHTLQ